MNAWIPLDLHEFKKSETKNMRGVDVEVSISPYDLPVAVRVGTENRVYRLEFKYLNGDSTEKTRVSEGINLHVGTNSDRIYAIDFEIDRMRPELDCSEGDFGELAIERFSRVSDRNLPARRDSKRQHYLRENLDLTKRLLQVNRERVRENELCPSQG
jgi:hypothetical protein